MSRSPEILSERVAGARLAVLEPPQRLLHVEDPHLLGVVNAQALRIADLERRLWAGSDDSGGRVC
jgi:hypothetical protein